MDTFGEAALALHQAVLTVGDGSAFVNKAKQV
jgi:hypothetical protein